jgi:subtilisin family serine protease
MIALVNFKKRMYFGTVMLVLAQLVMADSYYFYVQLSDKKNSPFSIERPDEFLSARAISRRALTNVAIDSTDLPVNPAYVQQLSIPGISLHSTSRWLNGVTMLVSDSSLMSQVRALPFVSWVQYTGKIPSVQPAPRQKSKFESTEFNYGTAVDQIKQLKGNVLHDAGFTGSGVLVGVLDAGYLNIQTNPAFDSLRLQSRLVGLKNIIDPAVDVNTQHAHGTLVLSVMAGNLPGVYLGTAPHASYLLIQTEHDPTEYLCEVDFWVAGIEYADSAGVDVVNSSLGYTEFDDATMNYRYADMNGQVSRASRAATMAAQKGILVCNSQGNSGTTAWKYLGAPADADGILAVGAVTSSGLVSSFSSSGPASDGRVKPDVTARGTTTALVSTAGTAVFGNGTSFSSPVVAGLAACFLQFARNQSGFSPTTAAVRDLIIASSSRYLTPDDRFGYGLPDFEKAMQLLQTSDIKQIFTKPAGISFSISPGMLNISPDESVTGDGVANILIFNVSGVKIADLRISTTETRNISMDRGVYVYQIRSASGVVSGKLIIP